MKIFVIFAAMMAVTLLFITYISNNGINEQQGFAQHSNMTAAANNTSSSTTSGNMSSVLNSPPNQSIYLRGLETSQEPVYLNFSHPGMKEQTINILPHRDDGAAFKGILTFTATEPVNVGIGHRLPVNKDILSQNKSQELRALDTVTYNNKGGELGDLGLISASSIIKPDYGVSPPYFSASIPFAGSNLYLTTEKTGPFVAMYEVSADIVRTFRYCRPTWPQTRFQYNC